MEGVFLAVRDIDEGGELCYFYKCRDEEWMKSKLVERRVVAGVTEVNKQKAETDPPTDDSQDTDGIVGVR